jgi:hypothetical protein
MVIDFILRRLNKRVVKIMNRFWLKVEQAVVFNLGGVARGLANQIQTNPICG